MNWYSGQGPRLSFYLKEIDQRAAGEDLPLLAVSTKHGVVRKSELSNGVTRADSLQNYKVVVGNDIVLNRFNAYRGALGLANERGVVSPDYSTLRPIMGIPRYFDYWLRSAEVANAMKSTMGGLGAQDPDSSGFSRVDTKALLRLRVHVPDVTEQLEIADYLDEQLVKIDLLIEKEKNLIMLSSERRIAAISDLVTRGFRQRGTSHWNACRLKHVATIFSSNVDKKTYDDGVPVKLCNYVNVYYNDRISEGLDFMEATASPGEIRKFQLRAGWVVATKDSESADDIGIAAYVDKDLPGVVCGYHLAILQPSECLNGLFLKYFLDSSEAKTQLAKKATGLTRVGLGKGDFGSLVINVPPLNEQELIAATITETCDRLDTLIAASKDLISKLEERRKALVSAAVTGKIDVRGKN